MKIARLNPFCAVLLLLTASCAQGPLGVTWGTVPTSSTSSSGSGGGSTGGTGGGGTGGTSPTLSLVNADETAAIAIIQSTCTSCHGTSSGPAGVYNLTDLTHLTSTGLVIVGSPNQSTLYNAMVSGVMPPTGALSASQLATISAWISGK